MQQRMPGQHDGGLVTAFEEASKWGLPHCDNPLGTDGGRYWDRTSDLRRVKTALYRLS